MSNEETKSVDLKSLFAKFEALDKQRNEAMKAVEKATAERSESVKAIAMAVGYPKNKRIKYNDNILSIVCKPVKGGGESWFFRGNSEEDDIISV